MKAPTKTEITAFLDKFQRRFRAVEKAQAARAQANADLEKFTAQIAEIGEPDYNDDKAIHRLATLQLKEKSATRALDTIEAKIGEAALALDELMPEASALAARVIEEIADNRLETVSRSLELFSLTKESARRVALETDACRGASIAISRYRAISRTLRAYTGLLCGSPETEEEYMAAVAHEAGTVITNARILERVLVETTSRAPDLLQFLPYYSHATGVVYGATAGNAESDTSAAPDGDAQSAEAPGTDTEAEAAALPSSGTS